jgi:hypothetical protein
LVAERDSGLRYGDIERRRRAARGLSGGLFIVKWDKVLDWKGIRAVKPKMGNVVLPPP